MSVASSQKQVALYQRWASSQAAPKEIRGYIEWLCIRKSIRWEHRMLSVAEPGFPRRGRQTYEFVDKNLLFGKNFAKNCIKIIKIDGEGASQAPP